MKSTSIRRALALLAGLALVAAACGDSATDESSTTSAAPATTSTAPASTTVSAEPGATTTTAPSTTTQAPASGPIDITGAIFTQRSGDCADYDATLTAVVDDITRQIMFEANVEITAGGASCSLSSDSIPNHDFNDASARFADDVAEVSRTFTISRNPQVAAEPTALSQRVYNGVMLNGVPIDLLSAGCYRPDDRMADEDGNVPIGCNENDPWLLDPLGTEGGFGVDEHNAHTQPGGAYHYHGDPHAMFDDSPGPDGSPVIGFAADGFPIYGSWFLDPESGEVREAISGYTLKPGTRPQGDGNPGGAYGGMYVDDWEYSGAGDLDACNGMTVDGQYGYYVTDSYPWIISCLSGTPDPSFSKGR